MSDLVRLRPALPLAEGSDDLYEELDAYVKASRSAATVRAYATDWRNFSAWASAHGVEVLPATPQTVALYISDLARTRRPATIRRRLAAISVAHQAAGHATPTSDIAVRSTWAGIRRVKGTAQASKAAILTGDIRRMVSALPNTLAGHRDACLILLGFAAALRRSELVGLDVGDIEDTEEGLVLSLRKSKTDQERAGREVGVPYGSDPRTCPVRAFRRYVARSQITDGPLFRAVDRHGNLSDARLSDKAVAIIVKRSAAVVGLDPSKVAGHSLRSGMATSAARAGASEASIMAVTGHTSLPVLRRYIRRGSLFTDNASARLGL